MGDIDTAKGPCLDAKGSVPGTMRRVFALCQGTQCIITGVLAAMHSCQYQSPHTAASSCLRCGAVNQRWPDPVRSVRQLACGSLDGAGAQMAGRRLYCIHAELLLRPCTIATRTAPRCNISSVQRGSGRAAGAGTGKGRTDAVARIAATVGGRRPASEGYLGKACRATRQQQHIATRGGLGWSVGAALWASSKVAQC
jgi:hypothetical protein